MRLSGLGLLLFVVVLAGCTNEPVASHATSNPAITAEVLFEVDGYRVYRFEDGRTHYFVTPRGSAFETHTESCGKNCTRTITDEISTVNP